MRTSYFISPKHKSKVCSIAAESVVQLYTNTNELYYSNINAYIIGNKIHLYGHINSDNHFSEDEIEHFIKTQIETDLDINLCLKYDNLTNELDIKNAIFLGYSNNENPQGIPFEHLEAIKLCKLLYDTINAELLLQITINGIEVKIIIETDYENHNDIRDIIKNYYLNTRNWCSIVQINKIKNNELYKSDNSFISNTYGPRVPYSNTQFCGLSIYSNLKYGHLVSKDVSDFYLKNRKLNYSLIELTYESDNEIPIQKAIKGNNSGIHIEHGTFFENDIPNNIILSSKKSVINYLKETPNCLIDMARWGYLNFKI